MRLKLLCVIALLFVSAASAQVSSNFVTYDHYLEERGSLEVSTLSTVGIQKHDLPNYLGQLFELEYGVTGWWTSSLYLEGASQHDSTVFTGFRLENRFLPLKGEHKINPVLYFEYEDINEASRIQTTIVGHSESTNEPLSVLRGNKARELEGKLILSSNVKNWNISENFAAEKNLTASEGIEFGYAIGAYRPLSVKASAQQCSVCRDKFVAGAELYGGLGSTQQFGFSDTAQYIAPGIAWRAGRNSTLKFSPAFGLTSGSNRILLRAAYTYEFNDFGRKVSGLFGAK